MEKQKERKKRYWLIALREQRGLTQQETAAHVGISTSYYSAIECSLRKCPGEIGLKISKFFGFPLERMYEVEIEEKVKA